MQSAPMTPGRGRGRRVFSILRAGRNAFTAKSTFTPHMDTTAKIEGSVAAGFPSPAEQYEEPPLDLNAYLVKRPAATYFLRVAGDSMNGAGIFDGDLIVVDRSLEPADGDIAVASVDGEFTVKRFRSRGREVWLEPANPAYPAIRFSGARTLEIFGRVTAAIHKL